MTGKKSEAGGTERCTALCLEINRDKASGREDTEDDEHGGEDKQSWVPGGL